MVLAVVLLSVFALYGMYIAITEILRMIRGKKLNAGYRVILAVPEGAEENLEGVIREVFSDEIPERLLTDGKLYVAACGGNPEVGRIIRDMQRMYPIEVLPHQGRYCIITGSEINADS